MVGYGESSDARSRDPTSTDPRPRDSRECGTSTLSFKWRIGRGVLMISLVMRQAAADYKCLGDGLLEVGCIRSLGRRMPGGFEIGNTNHARLVFAACGGQQQRTKDKQLKGSHHLIPSFFYIFLPILLSLFQPLQRLQPLTLSRSLSSSSSHSSARSILFRSDIRLITRWLFIRIVQSHLPLPLPLGEPSLSLVTTVPLPPQSLGSASLRVGRSPPTRQ